MNIWAIVSIGFLQGKLYYCRMGIGEREFLIVNTETLQPEGTTPISGKEKLINNLTSLLVFLLQI